LQVQAVSWSHQSPELLLSGSFDKTVAMVIYLPTILGIIVVFFFPDNLIQHFYLQNDVKDGQNCHKWSVEADVESVAWDPHNEHSFVVSK
jgi:periodic tryptophan protein 1